MWTGMPDLTTRAEALTVGRDNRRSDTHCEGIAFSSDRKGPADDSRDDASVCT
jgi:hypothetical protein